MKRKLRCAEIKMWNQNQACTLLLGIVSMTGVMTLKTVYLPPSDPGVLLIGCYKGKNNDTILASVPNGNNLSTVGCLRACGNATQPLAVLSNGSVCRCGSWEVFQHVDKNSCPGNSSDDSSVYNATLFGVAVSEMFEETQFVMYHSNPKPSQVLSFDFGDSTRNTTLNMSSLASHRFLDTGTFTVTVLTDEGNSTISRTSRRVQVVSRIDVRRVHCPAIQTKQRIVCDVTLLQGTGIQAKLNIRFLRINVSFYLPDIPRIVMGDSRVRRIHDGVRKNETETGIYLIASAEVAMTTLLEAWEIDAVSTGFILLQVYRPTRKCFRNLTCTTDSSRPYGFTSRHCRPKAQKTCNESFSYYKRVYEEPVNLTFGYNLIVVNNSRKFFAKPGDLIGFQTDGSTAPTQYAPPNDTVGVYFTPNDGVYVNTTTATQVETSFSLSARGSIPGRTSVTISGFPDVGVYTLELQFENEVTAFPVFHPSVVVQNPILSRNYHDKYYIAVNTNAEVTVQVTNGTNVTCTWVISELHFTVIDSLSQDGRLTEAGNCTISANFTKRGPIEVSLFLYNEVSSRSYKMIASVRQKIAGLQLFLLRATFAYQNAFTFMSANVTHGDHVYLVWYFTRSNQSVKPLGEIAGHSYTEVGIENVKVSANNFVSFEEAAFSFRVVPNPLTIHMPSIVATERDVRIECNLTWSGGSAAEFFRRHNLTGQPGTNITSKQVFIAQFDDGSSNKSSQNGVFFHSFPVGLKRYKAQCYLQQNVEINTFTYVETLDPVVELEISSNCSSHYVVVYERCSFTALVGKGDNLNYLWTIVGSSGSHDYRDESFVYQFTAPGSVNVSLNVSNNVSSNQTFVLRSVVLFLTSSIDSTRQRTVSKDRNSPNTAATVATTWRHGIKTVQISSTSIWTPTPSGTLNSKNTSIALPVIANVKLLHPSFGAVGQRLHFHVQDVVNTPLVRFQWNWGDGAMSDSLGPTGTHTYTESGRYHYSVKVYTSSSQVMLLGHVTIQFSITGVRMQRVSLPGNSVLRLYFEIAQGTNVSYTVYYGDGTARDSGLIQVPPATVQTSHKYEVAGQYEVSISVENFVGPNTTLSRTVLVAQELCIIRDVQIVGTGSNSSNCPEIMQEFQFYLASKVNLSCGECKKLFSWDIFLLDDSIRHVKLPGTKQTEQEELIFPASSMVAGLYKIILAISVMPYGVLSSTTGFFRVQRPGLVVHIDCGNARTVSRNKMIVLNASRSHDPNDLEGTEALSFHWFCDKSHDISCFRDSIARNESILEFPPRFLDLNLKYEFVVNVSIVGEQSAEAQQTVTLVEDEIPPLCVRCLENCAHKLTTAKPLLLSIAGCEEASNVRCMWQLYGPSGHRIARRSVDSQVVGSQFQLQTSELAANKTYKVFFNFGVVSAEYTFITDMMPSGGLCQVTPSEGQMIDTSFKIVCSSWKDHDTPLWYEFFFVHPEAGIKLLCYGWEPICTDLALPSGTPKTKHTVQLLAKITDRLGSYKTVSLKVKVYSFVDENTAGAKLRSYVQGPQSRLGRMLASGHTQKARQLMVTVATETNVDSLKNPGPRSPGFLDRVEVRRIIVKELSKCCSSFQNLQQNLGGLREATSQTQEILPDAQYNSAQGYNNMAKFLIKSNTDKPVNTEVHKIVLGISDVISASMMSVDGVDADTKVDWINDDNKERKAELLEKSDRATMTCLEGADNSAKAILVRAWAATNATNIQSDRIQLIVRRLAPLKIRDSDLIGQWASFIIPMAVKVQLGKWEHVGMKVISVPRTPFIFDKRVVNGTSVSSLEFDEPSGKMIVIKDTSEPISVFLRTNGESQRRFFIIGTLNTKLNTTVYRFPREGQSSFYLEVNCTGLLEAGDSLRLLWRKDHAPSAERVDFLWELTSCNDTVQNVLSGTKLGSSKQLFLELQFVKGNASVNDSDVDKLEYQVSMNGVFCYYWDKEARQWSTSGCEVGPLTSLSWTHCQCNHLTWFGSRLFVPPNYLHLDVIKSRLTDPGNYYPVLATLCTILGGYMLALIWARREDRRDVTKVAASRRKERSCDEKSGASVSPSNRPGHFHRYEIIVATGKRRHANTSARVAMVMSGGKSTSQPYLLKDSSRPTLTRASVDSFLVTTLESLGDLSCIRIWHDNSGSQPAWYVKHISVRELDTNHMWEFLCERWLAVDEGDGMIDRVFPVASKEELMESKRLFLTKAYTDLTDSHLWFSVFWRPPQSRFTRVQRVSCCVSLLLCGMMTNAMWYEADQGRYTAVDLGPFRFSWEQVSIGICSSLIVFPVNLLLVQIFRHCSPPPTSTSCCGQRKSKPTQSVHNNLSPISGYRTVCDLDSPEVSDDHQPAPAPKPRDHWTVSLKSVHLSTIFAAGFSKNASLTTSSVNLISPRRSSRSCNPDLRKASSSEAKGLPWWFVYVGWFCVILTSSVASVVTLLYGVDFGHRKSEQWLFSLFISVTQDILVNQPLKVVFLAVFFAYILKRSAPVYHSSFTGLQDDEAFLQTCDDTNEVHVPDSDTTVPPVCVPSVSSLKRARERRLKERQMYVILFDLTTFLVFTSLLLLIAYGNRDEEAFRQNTAVEDVLLKPTFRERKPQRYAQILKQDDFWAWVDQVLLQSIYNLPWYFYSGNPSKFVNGESGHLVGTMRLRQLRMKEDACGVPQISHLLPSCIGSYSISHQDEAAYGSAWATVNVSTDSKGSDPNPWIYRSSSELSGYSHLGKIETYSGGGYVVDLSPVYYKAVRQVNSLVSNMWIDRHTRAIFVEFTLYNPNSNLHCASTILVEAPPTGGLFCNAEFLTYRLYRYIGDFQLFTFACEFFVLIFVVYFTYREGKALWRLKIMYFSFIWNWLEFVLLIFCWVSITFYFIVLGLRKWTMRLQSDPAKFISFQYISSWQLMLECSIALATFTAFLKFMKLFRFNRRIYLLMFTLRHAGKELAQFFVLFGINFVTFAQAYFVLLSSESRSFSTFVGSMEKLLSVLLGRFNMEDMMTSFRGLGAGMFLLYIVVNNFLLINIFIAIIIDAFKTVKAKNDEMQNEFEALDFIIERFRELIGIRRLEKAAEPNLVMHCEPEASFGVVNKVFTRGENGYAFDDLNSRLEKLQQYVDVFHEADACNDLLCCYISTRIP